MRDLIIVNASNVVSDAAAEAKVRPLQTQIDRDFLPAWGDRAEAVKLQFATLRDIPHLDPTAWAIFLNKHSVEPGALGWHDDQDGRVFSRVFVGDCIRMGLDWGVTLSHEALEMMVDPDIRRVWRLRDGRLVPLEVCDAVEADDLAYIVEGHAMSNFVLPSYFSTATASTYDFRGRLRAPAPALAPGGYMSVFADGTWPQIYAHKADGLVSRRAMLPGQRRQARARLPVEALEIV